MRRLKDQGAHTMLFDGEPMRFGTDFGGVIVRNGGQTEEDTVLNRRNGEEILLPGVLDALRRITEWCDGRVWIVSKARPRTQALTLAWMQSVDFHKRTGVPADHVLFCLKREEKAGLCRQHAITHFVDDRAHVMEILRDTVPRLYHFGEADPPEGCPSWARHVTGWADVLRELQAGQPERV